jgi:RES domain-containing protein
MHTSARLGKVLPTLPRITIHGLWSRAIGFDLLTGPPPGAPVGSSPQPLWPGGSALHGARFTPKGGFNSLYLADDPVTALHEVVSVFTPPHGPPVTIKTSPWVVVVVDGVLPNVVDLSDVAVQKKLGTTTAELTGEWAYTQATAGIAPTQILSQAAFDCGILGFRYISAKNITGGRAIVVFTDHLSANPSSFIEVVDTHGNLRQRLP